MKIEQIAVRELVPYEKNPRRNDRSVEAVARSIERFGFKCPIVIDGDNVIVAGHARHKAAQRLGLEKVPCISAADLSPEQIRAFRLVDNKTSELATWDMTKLSTELGSLSSDLYGEFYQLTPAPETKPADSSPNEKRDFESMTFEFSMVEKAAIALAITTVLSVGVKETYGNPNRKSNALYEVVRQWVERKNCVEDYSVSFKD